MCTGRIDLSHILRAFSRRADGVFIGGCRLNECNYITNGNFHALGITLLCKKIMERIGLTPDRLRIEFMSSGEGIRFAEVMNDFGNRIKELGPLGQEEGIGGGAWKAGLEAVMQIVPYIRLVERERLRVSFRTEEEYRHFFAGDEFNRLFDELIGDPLATGQILRLLRENPLSTRRISEMLGMTPSEASRHLARSSRQGWIRYDEGGEVFAPA